MYLAYGYTHSGSNRARQVAECPVLLAGAAFPPRSAAYHFDHCSPTTRSTVHERETSCPFLEQPAARRRAGRLESPQDEIAEDSCGRVPVSARERLVQDRA